MSACHQNILNFIAPFRATGCWGFIICLHHSVYISDCPALADSRLCFPKTLLLLKELERQNTTQQFLVKEDKWLSEATTNQVKCKRFLI